MRHGMWHGDGGMRDAGDAASASYCFILHHHIALLYLYFSLLFSALLCADPFAGVCIRALKDGEIPLFVQYNWKSHKGSSNFTFLLKEKEVEVRENATKVRAIWGSLHVQFGNVCVCVVGMFRGHLGLLSCIVDSIACQCAI
jgi:ABC-type glycerol-3-phosphate transport system permease component